MAEQQTETEIEETLPYDGVGQLGQAIKDFKEMYCRGYTREWPLFWRSFADQAFADIIALEASIPSKPKKSVRRVKVVK